MASKPAAVAYPRQEESNCMLGEPQDQTFSWKRKEAEEDDDGSVSVELERDTWARKREYILSTIGYCVGLGNIWRFPYICMKNGGGAFLIPFLLALVACGLPCFLLESSLGQFVRKSTIHVWTFCPLVRGIGISMNILTFFCDLYYPMILGWSLIYLVNSFKSPLPWVLCDQSWNTPNCLTPDAAANLTAAKDQAFLGNNTTTPFPGNGTTQANLLRTTIGANSNSTSSTEEFWLHSVLEISTGLGDIGGLPWHTALALVVTNLFVLLGVLKGIKTSGKVVYLTATLPYLLLIVFLILGFTLPGSGDGALFYIKPNFEKLMRYEAWMEAAIQVFYSLGPAWGCLITMSSYNKFNNNVIRDSILLTFFCEGTSIFGGFVVFMILGHMAFKSGVHISKFANSGAGLAFVVYPEAISYLPLPQLWGLVFFLMLFTLGLDSMFVFVETTLTIMADLRPRLFHKRRVLFTSLFMLCITLVSLIFATRAGMYWFQLVDWYVASFAVLLQSALECIAVGWFYGADRFVKDIELMVGHQPSRVFKWAWKFVTPFLLLVLWALTIAFYKPPVYEGFVYPLYAEVIGWFIGVSPFGAVIYCAVREISKHPGSLKQRFLLAITPTHEWGPGCEEAREKYHTDPNYWETKA